MSIISNPQPETSLPKKMTFRMTLRSTLNAPGNLQLPGAALLA
jgi:hypothetical protein